MAFDCVVTFSGILAIVPGIDGEGNVDKICFVAPNGRLAEGEDPYLALDIEKLRPHRTFCQFSLADVEDLHGKSVGSESTGIWYLHKERLTFDLGNNATTFALRDTGLGLGDLDLPQAEPLFPQGGNRPIQAGSFIDSDCLTASPAREEVGAQIWLHEGDCSLGQETDPSVPWQYHPMFPGADLFEIKSMAHYVNITFHQVEKFDLVADKFSPGPAAQTRKLSLAPADGSQLHIKIVNFCDDNPLEWLPPKPGYEPDEDFAWYYLLMNKATRSWAKDYCPKLTTNGMLRKRLPVPTPLEVPLKAGNPNCNNLLFAGSRFDLSF